MLRLNLRIALRNLLKNKAYAAINVLGLTLGLTAFILLLLYIDHERSYDQWSPDLKNVYQVRERHDFATPDNREHWQDIVDSRAAMLLQEKVPAVLAATRVDSDWGGDGFSVRPGDGQPRMIKGMRDADRNFFSVFSYKFLYGDPAGAIDKPGTTVLTRSLAIKLFGTDRALGKTIRVFRWRTDPGHVLAVTGIIEEPTGPKSLDISGIMHTGDRDKDPAQLAASRYCTVYARLTGATDTAALKTNVDRIYLEHRKRMFSARKISWKEYTAKGNYAGMRLLPVGDVHANPPFGENWIDRLRPVLLISAFLFIISVINFVNLATAQSVQRAKEVGVKKVLGVHKKQLVFQFLCEAGLQALLSLFACIALIELVLPAFNAHFNVNLNFWQHPDIVSLALQLIIVFILVTLIAGIYPALVLAGYHPVRVLKGSYEHGLRGLRLRNALIVFQFVISVIFIIAVGVMQMQANFISNRDLGFDKDKLINLHTNYAEDFAVRLRRLPGVASVSTTTQVMGNAFNVPAEIVYRGKKISLSTVTVSMDALSTLQVQLRQGRLFSRAYKQDTINSVVLNESAARLLGRNVVGEQYDILGENQKNSFSIIGVIKDYHYDGLDKAVLPTVYKVTQLGGTSSTNNLLVRISGNNEKAVMAAINDEWKKMYPDFPMQSVPVAQSVEKAMEENMRLKNLTLVFSGLSVMLSLLGLFALSTFTAKRRTREIAVRKVLGASDLQIISMLNRSFILLVALANLIAWPVAYLLTRKWLDNYAYRIEMPLLPFVCATVISILICLITVSIQAGRAAQADPVKSLKYE
ncbi:ABC transporter permease [Pedobacter sp. SYP-B3415]|uniref:ABC transporter permease n=1 Tax=Pedobacter sp. SYP-B3415 TaxID=2496641 RepID=UPI00101DAA3E|nr:ABC transporter permease [Pedobacter sp. SYP-B3415]